MGKKRPRDKVVSPPPPPPKSWPDHLTRLNKLFQQLTPFCAFCEARLTTTMTFQRMKDAVPDLTIQDLAAIKVIWPAFIHYEYLPTASTVGDLQVQFGKPVSQKATMAKHQQQQQHMVKPQTILKTIQKNNTLFTQALDTFMQTHENLEEQMKQYILPEPSAPPPPPPPPDETRPCMDTILNELKQQPFYQDQTIYHTTLPAKPAQYGPSLPGIEEILQAKGIDQLYLHQSKAIDAFKQGAHVITSTSTSSGKSLIYQMAILTSLQKTPTARALLIFPTKALAQDQRRSLMDWLSSLDMDIKVSTYDGDTPMDQRAIIRSTSNIILTNPDMLHYSILPNATKYWRTFFEALQLVVIDEIHVYHGSFGTHMALILRRLGRLTNEYFQNHSIQFISCSATISDPKEHMEQLVGVSNIVSITQDGAPSTLKEMVIWQPPLIDSTQRRGAIAETADLLTFLMSRQLRTIVFCKLRKTCELLMKHMRDHPSTLLSKVHAYRGGYMPSTRRQIEQQMFRGDLLAIIATNALELGIDIGKLDVVIMVGVPWSLSNFWQQSGRAGRRNHDSLTMVVVDQNPMDQYYVKYPRDLFEKPIPPLLLDVDKTILLESHLQCAAKELSIELDRDVSYFGPELTSLCQDHLIFLPDINVYKPHPSRSENPWQEINIRGTMEEEMYAIVDITDPNHRIILEEIETTRVPFEVYVGAIFIHQGRTYLVDDCHMDQRYATVHWIRADWTTRQRDFTNVNVLQTIQRKPIMVHQGHHSVSFGNVEIETVVFGYHKLDKRNRILDSVEIYMDPILRQSVGVWVDVPSQVIHRLESLDIDPMAAIHAASHMMLALIKNNTDIKTECKSPHATRKRPNRVVIYEALPCGVLRQVYDTFESLIKTCQQCIDQCECLDGCPKCVYLASCSEQNILCSKLGAQFIFRSLLDMDPPQ